MAPVAGPSHGTGAHSVPPPNPGGYSVMMSEEDYHNTQSMEMTKFVREHFKIPKAPTYQLEKPLRCRTGTTRVEEQDQSAVWRQNHRRRHDHLTRGFNTPNNKPYYPIGDIQLDSQRLLLDALTDYLPKQVRMPTLTSRFGRRDQKPTPSKVETTKVPVKDLEPRERLKDIDEEEKLRERALATAGFAYIKQKLEESEAVLRAERGGQIFEKSIKNVRDLKKRQYDKGKKKPELTLNPPALDTWSPTSSPSSTPGPRIEDIQDAERRAAARKRAHWLGKVQCVQKIMNALHNIKSRDLRSRVPMSHDQVTHLYRDVMWEKPVLSQTKPMTGTKTQQTMIDAATRAHSSADTVSSSEQQHLLLPGQHGQANQSLKTSKPVLPTVNRSTMSVHGRAHHAHGDVSSPSPAPWKKFGYHANIRKGFRLERENRVDTWEDLLAATSPGPGHRNSMIPTLLNGAHPANAVMKWHQHHLEHKKQPYWMTVGVASDEKVKRPTQAVMSSSKRNVVEEPDAAAALEGILQNFKKAQKTLAREALQDLERLDRDRQRVIRQKFQVITMSPLFERTVLNLQAVRAHQACPVIAIDDDSEEIKLAPWYMNLKANVEAVLGKYDPDVVSIFNTLSQFSLEDGKSIPNAKEKLCLLVMSMPASQLLTIPMQLAIVFVLEEILWAPPRALSQWLHHRKVPLIIEIDMRATT